MGCPLGQKKWSLVEVQLYVECLVRCFSAEYSQIKTTEKLSNVH